MLMPQSTAPAVLPLAERALSRGGAGSSPPVLHGDLWGVGASSDCGLPAGPPRFLALFPRTTASEHGAVRDLPC